MYNLKIAIVDDKENDYLHLKELILNFKKENNDLCNIHIDIFNRGINFIEPFDDTYDAVFLDIDMPVISGLETAKKIRQNKSNMVIVFVTNYASLAIDGYGVDALGFIVKPAKEVDVNRVIEKILKIKEEEKDESKVVIKVKNGYQTIKPSEIKFIEVNIHDVYFYTTNGVFKTRGVLKKIEKDFDNKKFVKCSSCYLVNLDYVDSIEKDDVRIDGKKLKIARTKKKEFLEAFLNNYQ